VKKVLWTERRTERREIKDASLFIESMESSIKKLALLNSDFGLRSAEFKTKNSMEHSVL
jgi:hypothetical protein